MIFNPKFRIIAIVFVVAIIFHGSLLRFTYVNTYDAFIHMFFADHYFRDWWDPWEPRWYTGFGVTSYPPGTHMTMAFLRHLGFPVLWVLPIAQLIGIGFLVIGVYRFSMLWVSARAAGYAALAATFASSVIETIHVYGQLPTIFSLGLFLNGLPFVYRWLVEGRKRDFFFAVIFSAATTSAHHVTTIFGAVLFVIPLAIHAFANIHRVSAVTRQNFKKIYGKALVRGIILAVFMLGAIITIIFPYWYWSVTDPITQVSIPHGSRADYLEKLSMGLMFFVIPWGTTLFLLPYIFWKCFRSRLWPLGASILMCFILGTGGTTPISRMILRGAFDILTLDRFTFWASILSLPVIGLFLEGLFHGRFKRLSIDVFNSARPYYIGTIMVILSYLSVSIAVILLPFFIPTQPKFVDPVPVVNFMKSDEHDRWRYLTLGLGDQFAFLSAEMTAESIDGNYHSARRLSDMTSYSVERLENSKYLGVPGLGSLRQFLVNSDRYHLKYVFANDEFYDPLLFFSGWTPLSRFRNGLVIWEKPDVETLSPVEPRRYYPLVHRIMWGTLPPIALISAMIAFLVIFLRPGVTSGSKTYQPLIPITLATSERRKVARYARILLLTLMVSAALLTLKLVLTKHLPPTSEDIVEEYFDHIDFRRLDDAYQLLDPKTRPDYAEYLFQYRWIGGLFASYSKLKGIDLEKKLENPEGIVWNARLHWFTALGMFTQELEVHTIKREGKWRLLYFPVRATQTPERIQRRVGTSWKAVGRRQAEFDSDQQRDKLDRPNIIIPAGRLVMYKNRYSVIGSSNNIDSDPANFTVLADLFDIDGLLLASRTAGTVNQQRLLPAENGAFRISFNEVLSLKLAYKLKEYDPKLFIPLELPAAPFSFGIRAKSVVIGQGLYRSITLNNIDFYEDVEGLHVTGSMVNGGNETANITRLTFGLYDRDQRLRWVDSRYMKRNLTPGQSDEFSFVLPPADDISVISELDEDKILINGSSQHAGVLHTGELPISAIQLNNLAGYSGITLSQTTMTYDTLR